MKSIIVLLTFVAASMAQAELKPMGLKEAKNLLSGDVPSAVEESLKKTPKEYSFFNKDGENTVAYVGQVMRNVLISDSKLAFGSMKYGELEGKKRGRFSSIECLLPI